MGIRIKSIKAPSGMMAYGHAVPANRLSNAYEALKEMLPNATTDLRQSIINKAARLVHEDMPYYIIGAITDLDDTLAHLDLTGRYRLLAHLLVD